MNRILVTRTDRLGDVLMTLPTLKFLRESLPDFAIDFFCRRELTETLGPTLADWRIDVTDIPADNLRASIRQLRSRHYDGVLCLFNPPKLNWALLGARIPVRVGMRSKPHTFFTLTSAIRQRRSQSLQNEAEYNLDLGRLLVNKLGGQTSCFPTGIKLRLNEMARAKVFASLRERGIDPELGFVVVHPGMGGSALNLSVTDYRSLIERVGKTTQLPLLLSIGPSETDQSLRRDLSAPKVENFELPELMELFRAASLVVAPSTGPLHLAHYVGTPTLGLYSTVQSQRPERWAPWGGSGTSKVISPSAPCPGEPACLEKSGTRHDCMDSTPWADLAERQIKQFNFK